MRNGEYLTPCWWLRVTGILSDRERLETSGLLERIYNGPVRSFDDERVASIKDLGAYSSVSCFDERMEVVIHTGSQLAVFPRAKHIRRDGDLLDVLGVHHVVRQAFQLVEAYRVQKNMHLLEVPLCVRVLCLVKQDPVRPVQGRHVVVNQLPCDVVNDLCWEI